MNGVRIPDDTRAAVRAAVQAGSSMRAAARQHGISHEVVRTILGDSRPTAAAYRQLCAQRRRRAQKMRAEGHSIRAIAHALGVSRVTVWDYLRHARR